MTDDVYYTILLIASVGAGPLVRYANSPLHKQWLSSLAGVALIAFACGVEAVHPLAVTLGNCLIIFILGPRSCHLASFVWCFGYLSFFRAAHLFGFARPHPVTNALQLFNTLRMIGVAFEVHDSSFLKRKPGESDDDFFLRQKYETRPSSALDIIHYTLCHVGLFTGPYFKFRTYQDMLLLPREASIPMFKSAAVRIKQLPIVGAVYLVCTYFFSIEYVKSEEFSTNPFWFRLFYMVPMFQIFRTRLYLAWIMSELMCMTSSLGAYPTIVKAKCGEGPTDIKELDACEEKDPRELEYDFETIHNLDIWGCELAPTTRDGLRSWNMSVQYWLAAFIHRRTPRSLGAFRVAVTMGVSAFWHGIHPGYYMSFLTVPPILVAEDLMIAAFRQGSASKRTAFDWVCWFCKMRGFDYMCMGFLLLTFDHTIGYWSSIYFIVHIVVVIFIIIGVIMKPGKSKKTD